MPSAEETARQRIAAAKKGRTRGVDLSELGLNKVPEELRNFPGLTILDLSYNNLTDLPRWFGDFTKLESLELSANRLTALPDRLSNLANLRVLFLSSNHLTELPDWLTDLPQLRGLYVENNPLRSPPPEIVARGERSIMAFLRARKQGSVRQWTSKMLVVGEGGVGKTSTIKVLLGKDFDKSEKTTHGLKIYKYQADHPYRRRTPMELSTWDFGGQEIYHATHQFFLSDRSLFLLLWNSRLGWEQGRLRYWLDIITARAPESPILLVATNAPASGRPADLPFDDLFAVYPKIVHNLSIDNETRDGIEELRDAIAEDASQLPLMGTEWPAAWLAAADLVRSFPGKHITPEHMSRIMTGAGLTYGSHRNYVADALHHLGDILYYKDVPSLADTVILRPEWVNEYISKVLDSPEVKRSHGLLSREHVNELWSDLDRGMRDHFLDMMDRYDLSYRLDGGTGQDVSLVIERLPWNAPAYEEQWNRPDPDGTEHEIRVLYQLNTTPPGIPTWFIARTHRFSTNTHWRTGALLAHPDGLHRALLKTNQHRHQIELTVRGPSPAAFFAVLDDGLTLTLDRYPGLSIKRLVPCPCQSGRAAACEELFDYDDLVRRLNRKPPRQEIECHKSGDDVNVPLMLLGLAPSENAELRGNIERLARAMTEQNHALADRLTEISGDMQRTFLKVQHQIQLSLEARCPSVFTVVPIKNSKIEGSLHELRLYCEEPGAWHPLPENEGCYQLKDSPKWLRQYGPYLHRLITVLKHVAPLVSPVLGMAVSTISERTKSEVDTMEALVGQLPTSASYVRDDLDLAENAHPIASASLEGDFRKLEAILTGLDPKRVWGGLSRIDTPEGLALYLCRDHAAPYLRTARAPVASP
ncbi:MAG TPA: COR domain-containing protein [Actinocrinis sp.]|uniref:COR domain-containing protein n=1 Tax=Actinocrinis sp. TaxID=1920516 RepID=UPI002DDC9ACB|nr:COR domain-containing protein [Actinocrinis sp.]HEV2345938.1 COR domain-containing protein [Actinocrinis sp.]